MPLSGCDKQTSSGGHSSLRNAPPSPGPQYTSDNRFLGDQSLGGAIFQHLDHPRNIQWTQQRSTTTATANQKNILILLLQIINALPRV